jgi:hypothetical protein
MATGEASGWHGTVTLESEVVFTKVSSLLIHDLPFESDTTRDGDEILSLYIDV